MGGCLELGKAKIRLDVCQMANTQTSKYPSEALVLTKDSKKIPNQTDVKTELPWWMLRKLYRRQQIMINTQTAKPTVPPASNVWNTELSELDPPKAK